MIKKLVATLAFISISLAGLVSISSPASAAGDSDATLKDLTVTADVAPNNQAFYSAVAGTGFEKDQYYYNVYSSRQNLRIYAEANDPAATVKVTGGNLTNYDASNSTDQYWTSYKVAPIVVQEDMNQIVNVVVTSGDGLATKTYKINIATGSKMPTPQLISNSLTSISNAGGTRGIMYIKNYNRCTYIEMKYNYTDRNGDVQVATEEFDTDLLTTDNNGISKVSVRSDGNTYTFRNDKVLADLVIKNDASLRGNWNDGYYGCLDQGYQTSAYADTVVPNGISFFNPTVTSVDVPATISQLSAFKVSGKGINGNGNFDFYLLNPATGNKLWLNSNYINNDSLLLTVPGWSNSEEWRTNQTLELYIEQYDSYDGNDEGWVYSDPVVLYSKTGINFKPKMASQVAVSPAKGPVSGGNKVTITGHGIYNSDRGEWAEITIGGNPVLDFRGVDTDYYSSSDNKNWDGVSKATFIVPAGVAGTADIVVDMGYGPTTLSQKYVYGDKPTVTSVSPSTVAVTGNSMITLTGTNFGVSGTPVVIIDGVKSPYVVRVSSTKVLALVPPKSSAGVVSVDIISSSGGGALDKLAKLTYAARGANPTITKITPATDGLSGGNEVVITGTGFVANATGVTIGGVAAKVTSSTATTLKIESPTGEVVGAADVVIGTPTGMVTKAKGFTYKADPGISSVSPNTFASTNPAASNKATISGNAFGTTGTITIGTAAPIKYTATGNGTTISNIAIPTTKAGSVKISVLPTGAKKPFTSSVTVTGPKISYVGPEDIASSEQIFGDVNPWEDEGWGVPASPANNGSEIVVIEGSGFGSAGSVKIGTTTVQATSYTDTKVTFVAPSKFAAGTYDVTVVPSIGTLTAVSPSAVVIGPQLSVPLIEKVEVNTPISDPNRESNPNVFWPLVLTDSDLYTITGSGFLGSDAGASTKLRSQSFYDYKYNYDAWIDLEIVSKTDTTIVFKANRSMSYWDWKALQIVTKDNQVVLGEGLYYEAIDDTYNNSPAYLENYEGLCNKDAIGTYTPGIFRVVDNEGTLTESGVVKLDGTVVPSSAVTWTATGVVINFDNQTAISDIWGPKKLELLPSGGQDPISWMITCGVATTITTKLNGSTAALTVAAGTSFTPSAEMNNPLPGTTWTEPADNYEFQTQEAKNVRGGWTKGLPVRPGVYYVRARITGSLYDTTKYYSLGDPADVKVTITGTPITFTPKLVAGGSSLTYKGQLGDGTNGTTADIGYTVSPTPADAISSVSYQYRIKGCSTGWASGLPKNVAITPVNCGGDGVATGVWEIRVANYTMNVGGVDKTIYYIPTFAVFELTINKKDVTLSSVKAEKVYDGTTSVTLNEVVVTGGIKDENLLLDQTFARGATFPEATAGNNKTVTLSGPFKLAGIFNTNYRITNPDMTVKGEIKKANTELKVVPSVTALVLGQVSSVDLTVTALDTKTKRAPIAEAGVAEPVLVSATPGICTLSGTTVTPVSAGKCVISATQAASTNYNAGISYANSPETTETVTINIYATPKDLSIVADDLKIAVGSALNPTATATGLLGEDSFDGVEFDFYQGSTKLNSAPTAIGTYKMVPKGGSLTAASEAAYTGVKKYIAGKLVITPAPPVITSISPSHGPEAGGETVTIKGTGFGAVTSITLGANTIRKPAFTVNGSGTQITFVVPKGVGGLDIALNAGTAQADALYTYDAPFRAPTDVPTEEPTTPKKLTLDLSLKLKVGTKLSGQKVGIAGGGLKAFSTYKLEMFSSPILVYTGTTDKDGNFNENVTLPAKVCIEAGKHTLKLSGITPEGKATSDSDSFSLLAKCEVGATAVKTGDKQWTLNGFLFGYNSPDLSAGGKQSLNDLVAFIKGAKTVTILGYTETDTKSATIKALNLILAKKRTVTVMEYLKSKGIKAKFVTIGKGGVDPVSLKDQSKNRRVVIKAQY